MSKRPLIAKPTNDIILVSRDFLDRHTRVSLKMPWRICRRGRIKAKVHTTALREEYRREDTVTELAGRLVRSSVSRPDLLRDRFIVRVSRIFLKSSIVISEKSGNMPRRSRGGRAKRDPCFGRRSTVGKCRQEERAKEELNYCYFLY